MLVQSPWLRIIHVNEGAQWNAHQLAALKTLVNSPSSINGNNNNGNSDSAAKRPHLTLVTLGGNFLGPSIQSSLDGGGAAAMDLWNAVGVTHAVLGTHECNHLTASTLAKLLDVDSGNGGDNTVCVVNTNAPPALHADIPSSVPYDVLEIVNGRGVKKRIAVVGFVSDDPHLHAVGGVCANAGGVKSVVETAQSVVAQLKQKGTTATTLTLSSSTSSSSSFTGGRSSATSNRGFRRSRRNKSKRNSNNNNNDMASSTMNSEAAVKVDLIVPLTHQSAADNRTLANHMGPDVFPIILCGGGDSVGIKQADAAAASASASAPRQSSSPHALHLPLCETQGNGVQLIQPGADVVAVVDVQWKVARPKPSISVQMVPLLAGNGQQQQQQQKQTPNNRRFSSNGGGNAAATAARRIPPPHPQVLERALSYEKLFFRIMSGRLFRAERWLNHARMCEALHNCGQAQPPEYLSTTDHTQGMSMGVTALATLLRMGWLAPNAAADSQQQQSLDALLLPAHVVVGNAVYHPQHAHWFTWRDWQRELPRPVLFTTALLPGKVLQDTIRYSRRVVQQPTLMQSYRKKHIVLSFLHTCSHVQYTAEVVDRGNPSVIGGTIETIQGEPLDLDKEYWVAFPLELLNMQRSGYKPILQWAIQHPSHVSLYPQTCQTSDLLMARSLASTVWFQPGSFLDLRVNGTHGYLTRDQMERLIQKQLLSMPSSSGRGNAQLSMEQEDVSHRMADHILALVAANEHDTSPPDALDYSDDDDESGIGGGVGGGVGGADDDIVTPVDVMMVDPIVLDSVLYDRQRQLEQQELQRLPQLSPQHRQQPLKSSQQPPVGPLTVEQQNAVLRDCAADFVAVDDHVKQVTELVEQFRETAFLDEDEDNDDDDDDDLLLRLQGNNGNDNLLNRELVLGGGGGGGLRSGNLEIGMEGSDDHRDEVSELHAPLVRRLTRAKV